MAARKRKTTKKTVEKKFIALISGCGSASQLAILEEPYSGAYLYATEKEARKAVDNYIEYTGNDGSSFVIASILDTARANRVSWGAKPLE